MAIFVELTNLFKVISTQQHCRIYEKIDQAMANALAFTLLISHS